MRFLCPKCKAKYQIADEKLEGRAVRMKCRKCGHVIEVPTPAAKASPSTAPAALPRSPRVPSMGPIIPVRKPTPLVKLAPPRPGAVGAPSRPATPGAPPVQLPGPVPLPAPSASPVVTEMSGGLASAFSQKLRDPQPSEVSAAIEVLSAGAAEEWYVGINGVPLGPVRLSTLRQKAQQGVIDEDSLVWREGFEEWLPLRTFPELVVLVRESRESGSRASFLPSPPQAHSLSQPAQSHPAPAAAPMTPLASPATRPGAAAEIEQEPATIIASSPEGLAAVQQVTSAVGQVTSDPFAPGPATPAPGIVDVPIHDATEMDEGARRSLVDDIALGVRKQVRLHPAAYVLIAIAFGFGATGAVVFFTNDRSPAPPPTIQVVTVAAPTTASPGGAEPATSVAMNTEGDKGTPGARPGGGLPSGNGTKTSDKVDTPAEPDDKGSTPRKVGLGAGPSTDGPNVGGPSGGPGGSLPQQLDQSDIERVVAAHRVSVKRGCWEPALASRDPKSPKSAKVTVSISIGPSGRVSSASASGGSGYPSLSSCVSSKVRSWKFPPSGGTSQANIPFAFFSQ